MPLELVGSGEPLAPGLLRTALAPSGAAIAAWRTTQRDGPTVHVALRQTDTGAWAPYESLGSPGQSGSEALAVALDDTGRAVLAWTDNQPLQQVLAAATRDPLTGWGPPAPLQAVPNDDVHQVGAGVAYLASNGRAFVFGAANYFPPDVISTTAEIAAVRDPGTGAWSTETLDNGSVGPVTAVADDGSAIYAFGAPNRVFVRSYAAR